MNSGHSGESGLSLECPSSALESMKIHNFRVWQKDYFVDQPSKKVCVFSISVDFLIILKQISNASVNRKEDAPDLRITNKIKHWHHYCNSELQNKGCNKDFISDFFKNLKIYKAQQLFYWIIIQNF